MENTNNSTKKIYVGRARYVETKYGKFPRIWLTPEGVEAINANVDSRGGINLEMHELRQPDRGGFTHYLIVDQWKPSAAGGYGGQAGRNNAGNGSFNRDSRAGGYSEQGGHRYGPQDRNPPEPPRWDSVSPAPHDMTFEDIPF